MEWPGGEVEWGDEVIRCRAKLLINGCSASGSRVWGAEGSG